MSEHSENHPSFNAFSWFWDYGYRAQLPVIPPHVDIRSAGKRPGSLSGGTWFGHTAADYKATPETIEAWFRWGASLGLSCNSTGLCAVDIDTLSESWAKRVTSIAFEVLGVTARRVGRAPKILLPYRCDAATAYRQVRFRDDRPAIVDDKGRRKEKPAIVELLAGDAKFFVAWGIHPDTKRRYEWLDGIWEFQRLPFVTAEQIETFMQRLKDELPQASGTATGSRSVDQAALAGDPALVAAAMAFVPNDVETVGYNEWRNVGAALRGALPNDHALGLELFETWTDKGGVPSPTERADRVFDSFDEANLALGANYIFDLAEKGGWKGRAAQWFDSTPEEPEIAAESIFGEAKAAVAAEPYDKTPAARLPPREFLYGYHYVREFISMTVAPTKTGKSSFSMVEALAMASGRRLLDVTPKGALRVWLYNGEDPLAELNRRFAAARLHYGIDDAALADRLFVNSGRSSPLIMATETKGGVTILDPVVDALVEELRRLAIDVLIIDPFVSFHRVSESDNTAMEAVAAKWSEIADRTRCAIDLVHHARKGAVGAVAGADSTIDAARGASAVIAKTRSARALTRMTKEQAKKVAGVGDRYRSYFRVTDAQSNLVAWADDETTWLRLISVDLGNGPGESAERWSAGDHIGVVTLFDAGSAAASVSVESSVMARVLAEIRRGEFRYSTQTKDAWVGTAVAVAMGVDLEEEGARTMVRNLVETWLKSNVLRRVQKSSSQRKPVWYVEVNDVFG